MLLAQLDLDELRATVLVVVIEPDNMKRMTTGDPITLEQQRDGGYLRPVKYPEGLRMIVACEADAGPLYEMLSQGKHADLMSYLMRGYKFEAEDGKRIVFPKEMQSS